MEITFQSISRWDHELAAALPQHHVITEHATGEHRGNKPEPGSSCSWYSAGHVHSCTEKKERGKTIHLLIFLKKMPSTLKAVKYNQNKLILLLKLRKSML